MEVRMVMDAFVIDAFVVDNDDDENDLVRILVRLIHEYANLNENFFFLNHFIGRFVLQCPLPFAPRPALTKQSFNDKLCLTLFRQDLFISSAKYRYLFKIEFI
jgi:hypothetical protein